MGNLDLSDSEIDTTWNKVADMDQSTNWMVLHYLDKKTLAVKSSGTGGLSELSAVFSDDEVMFGFLRVAAEDRKAVTSSRAKTAMITWIGPNVGIMKKAKVGPDKQEISTALQGIQFFVAASEKSDVDMGHLASELLRSGGAHKPTHYIFGPDQEVALADMGNNFKTYV